MGKNHFHLLVESGFLSFLFAILNYSVTVEDPHCHLSVNIMSGSIGIVRQQATGNRQEGLRARKKLKFFVDIHPNFYTNDTNGHDITGTYFS